MFHTNHCRCSMMIAYFETTIKNRNHKFRLRNSMMSKMFQNLKNQTSYEKNSYKCSCDHNSFHRKHLDFQRRNRKMTWRWSLKNFVQITKCCRNQNQLRLFRNIDVAISKICWKSHDCSMRLSFRRDRKWIHWSKTHYNRNSIFRSIRKSDLH